MEGITFGVEIEILVRPKLEKADFAQELDAEGWIRKPLLSNRERRTNIERLRQILARNLTAAGIPTHTKKQPHEKWTMDRDASIVEPEDANGLRPFGSIEVPIKRDTVISSIQTSLDRGLTEIEGRLRNYDRGTSDYKSSPRVGCGWNGELWRRCLSTGEITSGRPPTICADRITKAPNYAICTRKLLRQIVLLSYFLSSMKRARPKSLYIIHADPEWLLGWRLKRISTCGTVEFRKPPQSFSAEDTIHWVEMTVGIVESALAANLEDELTLKPPAILTSI